jgi:CBS domain containing-hemolysin-like protein
MSLIVGTLLMVAFFSGIEIAFVSANRLRMELITKKGGVNGKILGYFIKNPGKLINTTLVGNNVALVVYGTAMSHLLDPIITEQWNISNEWLKLITDTAIATLVVLILGEYLPKLVFQLFPNELLMAFALPLQLAFFILYFPVTIMTGFARWFLRVVFKTNFEDHEPAFGKTDLAMLAVQNIANESNEDETIDQKIFKNALELTEEKVRDCMVPRSDLVGISKNAPLEEVKKLLLESQFSKILVYDSDWNQVLGFVHILDIMTLGHSDWLTQLHPVYVAPESMLALDLLEQMNKSRISVALIVDEFGETSGMLTREDVLEEVFGEILDEHDTEEILFSQINPGVYRISARCKVEEINEKIGLKLPDNEADTLGGLVFHTLGRIPKLREKCSFDSAEVTVISVVGPKIKMLELRPTSLGQPLSDGNELVEG